MKKRAKLSYVIAISTCLILLTGCNQSNPSSSKEAPVTFSTAQGGLDGKGTKVIEWGEEPNFQDDMYFKLNEDVDRNDIKVHYEYDADNVGKIQDMKVVVEYDGKEYQGMFPILIDDTHSPEISFSGDKKVMVNKLFDTTQVMKVTDKKGNGKEDIKQCDQFNKFYQGYIVVFTDAKDEEGTREALQAQAGNELDVENPGTYKMTIKASDGHGNVTSEVVDIEVVDELIYK